MISLLLARSCVHACTCIHIHFYCNADGFPAVHTFCVCVSTRIDILGTIYVVVLINALLLVCSSMCVREYIFMQQFLL